VDRNASTAFPACTKEDSLAGNLYLQTGIYPGEDTMTLEQLLHNSRRGKAAAQKALYERLARPLFALCRRYLKSDVEAEEVLHNGFLKLFAALEHFRFNSEAASMAWIKRIFINECLMHLRRQHSFLQVALEDAADVAAGEDTLERFATADILEAILQLPLGYRTVFNLYAVEEYSHKEIAALLGISEGTSKSQLSKARSLLQQTLIRKYPEYALRKTR